MSDKQTEEPRPPRRRRRWPLVLAAVLLAAAFCYWLPGHIWRRRWAAMQADLRAQGIPASLDDLPAVEDPTGQGQRLLEALGELQNPYALPDPLVRLLWARELRVRCSPARQRLMGTHLAGQREALEVIHQASAVPGVRLPIGPPDMDGQTGLVAVGARLVGLEAELRAQAGDPSGAARSLATMVRIVAARGGQAAVWQPMVSAQMGHHACRVTEHVLALTELAPSDLQSLLDAMPAPDARQPVTTIDTWIALAETFCSDEGLDAMMGWLPEVVYGHVYRWVPGWRQRDAVHYSNMLLAVRRAVSAPAPEAVRRLAAAYDAIGEERKPALLVPLSHIFTYIRAGHVCWDARELLEAVARRRVLQVALQVEAHRMAHGQWPEALSELADDLPPGLLQDPFGHGQLRYVETSKGRTVYSIGADLTDDGGIPREEAQRLAEEHGESGSLSTALVTYFEPDESLGDVLFRLVDPGERGAVQRTLREEAEAAYIDISDLHFGADLTKDDLLAGGYTAEEIENALNPPKREPGARRTRRRR